MQKALIFPAGAKKPMQIGAVAANTGSLGARRIVGLISGQCE